VLAAAHAGAALMVARARRVAQRPKAKVHTPADPPCADDRAIIRKNLSMAIRAKMTGVTNTCIMFATFRLNTDSGQKKQP
jgi:hypothetical protein